MSFSLFLFLFFSTTLSALANPINLDPHFGKNGKVLISLSSREDRGEVVAIQKDHKIVVVGVSDLSKKADIALVRYFPDGKLDLSFGTEGKVFTNLGGKEAVYGLAIQKDGKILVGGYTQKNGRMADFAIVRYHSNGDLDKNFGKKGKAIQNFGGQDEIHYLVLDENDQILVAGFSQKGTNSKFILARYLSDGSRDLTFNKVGFVSTSLSPEDRLYGLALQKDKKILVTGSSKLHEQRDCIILRYFEDGNLDKTFGKEGIFSVEQEGETVCSAITVQPNQKILVTGYKTESKKNTNFILARIQSDGKIDKSFGDQGYAVTDFEGGIDVGHGITALSSGEIILGGEAEELLEDGHSLHHFALARYLSNGKLDFRFGDHGKVTTRFGNKSSSAEALALQKDGKIILVGEAEERFAIVRYLNPLKSSK